MSIVFFQRIDSIESHSFVSIGNLRSEEFQRVLSGRVGQCQISHQMSSSFLALVTRRISSLSLLFAKAFLPLRIFAKSVLDVHLEVHAIKERICDDGSKKVSQLEKGRSNYPQLWPKSSLGLTFVSQRHICERQLACF